MTMAHRFCVGLLALVVASAMAQTRLQNSPPGPAAQAVKTVVFIASDFRNGGGMGVRSGQKATQASLLTRAVEASPGFEAAYGAIWSGK